MKSVFPNFPTEAIKLTKERDELQEHQPGDPKIAHLTSEIDKVVQNHKREAWRKFLESVDHKGGTSKLMSNIQSLNGAKQKLGANGPIEFEGKIAYKPMKCTIGSTSSLRATPA